MLNVVFCFFLEMRSREERENADRIQREIFQLEQRFLNCIEASTYCQVSFQDIESVSDALFPTREGNFGIFKSPNNPVTIKASWLPVIYSPVFIRIYMLMLSILDYHSKM